LLQNEQEHNPVAILALATAPMKCPLTLGIRRSVELTGAFHQSHFHQRSKDQLPEISILLLTSHHMDIFDLSCLTLMKVSACPTA
jgi:hypothetical protein